MTAGTGTARLAGVIRPEQPAAERRRDVLAAADRLPWQMRKARAPGETAQRAGAA